MSGQASSDEERREVPDEVWEKIVQKCFDFVGNCFKEGSFIMFLHNQTKELRHARVDKVIENGKKAYAEIVDGVFLVLEKANCVWCFVDDRYISHAKTAVKTVMDVGKVLRLTSTEGLKVIVLASAAEGLFGGAAVTSGLATLGGGSVAAGGLGMAGGIVVVACAPSMLSASAPYNLRDAVENNTATPTAVAIGGLGGVVVGTTVGVIMVSEAGVAGMSTAGITSGLAALFGGSVAAGGAGMLGGLAVVAGTATGITFVVGGVVWLLSSVEVQDRLKNERKKVIDIAVRHGFDRLI